MRVAAFDVGNLLLAYRKISALKNENYNRKFMKNKLESYFYLNELSRAY